MLLLAFLFSSDQARAAAEAPRILNYQGRLLDSAGNPLGNAGTDFCFKFSIYDDALVGAPDNKLWPSGIPSTMTINVKNGVFNVGVGDVAAGSDALTFNFQDTDTIYLNAEVATKVDATCAGPSQVFETLGPRQRVVSSAYALNASAVVGIGQSAIGITTPISGAVLTVAATSSNVLPFLIQGAPAQTADLFRIQDAGGSKLLFANLNGGVFASSTLQVTGSATLYATLLVGGLTSLVGGFISSASSSIGGPLSVTGAMTMSSTLLTTGLSTLQGGFISSASSSIGSLLNVSGNLNASSALFVAGALTVFSDITTSTFSTGGLTVGANQLVVQQTSGNIGIGTTTPKEKIHLADGNFLQDSPISPKVIGGAALSLPGGSSQLSYVSGRYVYAVFDNIAGTNILRIIDATDPANPAVIGGSALSLPGFPRSIYVAGRYAYILFRNTTTTDIFRIVDISNHANPSVAGGTSLSLPANGQHVFVSGRYAYATFDNGAGSSAFRVIDVSNPASPVVVGGSSLNLPASPRQVYVSGRYAYVAFYSAVNTDAFRIIDISDPRNPAVVGGASLVLGFSAWSVHVSGRYAYLGFANNTGGQIFRVVDISNPASPSIAGGSALDSVLPGFAKSVFVSGRYAYVTFDNAAGTSTFRVIDVANPSSPTVVGGSALSLPGFPRSVSVSGHYAYLIFFQGAGTDIIRVIDISGLETVSALVHSLEAGSLQVTANAQIQNQLAVGGGINIDGGGLFASGGIGINGESLFAPLFNSTTTFRVQNAAGGETLFTADTVNNRIKIGDDDPAANPTTMLVLDTKADAGDPAGTNGATYYNTNAQKFRCFENGAWKDCDVTINTVRATADTTNTSATVPVDVAGLGIAVAASTNYSVRWELTCDAAAATTGIQLAVNGPVSPTAVTITIDSSASAHIKTFFSTNAYETFHAMTASAGATRAIYTIHVVLRNGTTAGTLIPRLRSEVANSAVNCRIGSWGQWF